MLEGKGVMACQRERASWCVRGKGGDGVLEGKGVMVCQREMDLMLSKMK